jgi:hypothetical protein
MWSVTSVLALTAVNDLMILEPAVFAWTFSFRRKSIPERTVVSSAELVNMQISREAWTFRTLAEPGLSFLRCSFLRCELYQIAGE